MLNWIKTSDGSSTLLNSNTEEMYHSKHGAWSECQHVFLHPFLEYAQKNPNSHKTETATRVLSHNELMPGRVEKHYLVPKPCWRILDVGFGLGLNWLCVVDEFLGRPQGIAPTIEIVSIEYDPAILDVQVTREQLGDFSVSQEAFDLLQGYKMYRKVEHQKVRAELIVADAMDSIDKIDTMDGSAEKSGEFDIIFHDPFSPQKNPACWSTAFFKKLSQICRPGTLLLTYSVARVVKDALADAGFEVRKARGFGGKRERLEAVFRGGN